MRLFTLDVSHTYTYTYTYTYTLTAPQTGPIYSFTGGAISLESLSISACDLTGTIPSQLANLPVIQEMRFSENRLIGTIPASLGNLKFLRTFQVEGNDLNGAMPEAICAADSTGSLVGLDELGADCLEVDVSVETQDLLVACMQRLKRWSPNLTLCLSFILFYSIICIYTYTLTTTVSMLHMLQCFGMSIKTIQILKVDP
jgi:hypothetical protein